MLDNYLSKIWTGGAKLFSSVSQYIFGLYQECEIFSKKWVGEAGSLLTVHQSDYFLKEGVWNEKLLNENRLTHLSSMRQTKIKDSGILVLDDTGVKRYKRDDARGVSHQYSGELDGTGYCKIVVTSHYVDDTKDFPLDMECYYKGEESKIALAKNLIEQAIRCGIRFTYVAFDSWYLCKELTDYIESL